MVIRALALTEGYWIDEVSSVETARLSWGDLVHRVGFFDLHPPLYYLLLSVWTDLFKEGEIATRMLSLLFAIGTLVIAYLWGARSKPWSGFLAVLLLALSTFHAHYSVEVRSYSMLAFLGAAFLYLYEGVFKKHESSRWRLVLLGVVEVCFVLTHYYAAPLVFAVNVHFFTVRKHNSRMLFEWSVVQGIALAFFMFWLPFLLVQLLHLPEGMFAHLKRSASVGRLLLAMGPATVHPSVIVAWLGSILVLGPALFGIGRAILRRPKAATSPGELEQAGLVRRRGRIVVGVLLLAITAPMISAAVVKVSETTLPLLLRELPRCYMLLFGALFLLFAGNLMNMRVVESGHRVESTPSVLLLTSVVFACLYALHRAFLPRNLIFLLPPLCVFVATVWQPRRMLAKTALLALVLSVTAPSLMRQDNFFEPRQDFKRAAQVVRLQTRGFSSGIANFVIPMWDRPGFEYYLGQGTANGLMNPSQIPPAVSLPGTVNIILTRQAFDNKRVFVDTIERILSPDFKQTGGGRFRGVFVAVFERTTKGASP